MSSGGYQISKQIKKDLFSINNDVLDIKRMLESGSRGQAKESVNRILKVLEKYVEEEKW